jgi:CelD/BcsL family acetyltransferase involved in cellulose biosynthesis
MHIRAAAWREMAAEREAWDALTARAAEPNPFFERWFLLSALQALDPGNRVSLLRFECEGELAGIMPIMRQARYYRWPFPNWSSWVHANCFLGVPLVAAGKERDFWQHVLGWADTNARQAVFLHLRAMPLDGPVTSALMEHCRETGREFALVHGEERALLQSSQSPQDYFEASLSGKKRKELRRQFARLGELGTLTFKASQDLDDVDGWIGDFIRLEAAGWKGEAGSAIACDPGTAALFRDAMRGAAHAGRLQRLHLLLDGKPIAMLASFLAPPGAFSFKTTFDERYARFSPGVLLQRENLEILASERIEWMDSCASADHPMIDHIWRERRKIGRISIAIGGKARRSLFHAIARSELGRQSERPEP